MIIKYQPFLTLLLAAAMWHASSPAASAGAKLALPKPAGDILAEGPVLLDGTEVVSGATFFPGSEIQTGESARAVLSLGAHGRAGLQPLSSLRLSFGDERVGGTLGGGTVRLSKPSGVAAAITTHDGSVVSGAEESALFTVSYVDGRTTVEAERGRVTFRSEAETVEVGAGSRYVKGQGQAGASNNLTKHEKGAITLGVGAAVALLAILFASGDDDEDEFAEPCIVPIIISPTDFIPC